jgi:hypothetical protein
LHLPIIKQLDDDKLGLAFVKCHREFACEVLSQTTYLVIVQVLLMDIGIKISHGWHDHL